MLLAALPFVQPPMDDPMAPLRFLSGQCWRGQFGESPAYDVMCAEDMPGGHIKARHMVRGIDGEYRGETVYFYDTEQQRIRFHYYTSLGAFQQGVVSFDGERFHLDPIRHVRADGTILHLRATGEKLGNGNYRTTTHFWREDYWGEPSIVTMTPIDCAGWAAVEAGCD